MSDIILIPVVALVSFVAGAAWMWRVVGRAFDEFEEENPRVSVDLTWGKPGKPDVD